MVDLPTSAEGAPASPNGLRACRGETLVRRRWRTVVLALCVLAPPSLWAQAVGDRIELKASHHLGVPLHSQVGGSPRFERVLHGAVAVVREIQQTGRWLQIDLPDMRSGWVSKRYVGRVLPPPGPDPDFSADEKAVWESPAGCEGVVGAGRRMPKSDPSALRAGT